MPSTHYFDMVKTPKGSYMSGSHIYMHSMPDCCAMMTLGRLPGGHWDHRDNEVVVSTQPNVSYIRDPSSWCLADMSQRIRNLSKIPTGKGDLEQIPEDHFWKEVDRVVNNLLRICSYRGCLVTLNPSQVSNENLKAILKKYKFEKIGKTGRMTIFLRDYGSPATK